jgi:hypothetical protein
MSGSYEIRIRGRLSPALIAAFEELQASVEPRDTLLHGRLDQSALHGLLARIQASGLELVEVRRVPGKDADEEGDVDGPAA